MLMGVRSSGLGDSFLDDLPDFGVVLDSALGFAVDEDAHFFKDLKQGAGLAVILFHAVPDDFLGVVFADDQLVAAGVAVALAFGEQGIHRVSVTELKH